jgi:DNA (cytosine-5)-methyltransferase 1
MSRQVRRVVDIFSGAGMLSAGFSRVGFRPTYAIDLDARAVASYNQNVAPVAIAGDATVPVAVRADVLLAGPPCQGFSTLGRRDKRDARNALSATIADWAAATHASVVVVENVPPFLESAHWKRLRAGLEDIGYEIGVWTLDAHRYGSGQRRTRSFTIASRIGLPNAPEAKPGSVVLRDVLRRIRTRDRMHVWPQHSPLTLRRLKRIPNGGDKRDLMRVAPSLCPPSWFRIGPQATDVWGRMRWDRPANTIRCEFQNPSKGRYIHPDDDRVLSLREGARLQGVPDGWDFVGGPVSIARQIGNGVPLELGSAVAARIAELF